MYDMVLNSKRILQSHLAISLHFSNQCAIFGLNVRIAYSEACLSMQHSIVSHLVISQILLEYIEIFGTSAALRNAPRLVST